MSEFNCGIVWFRRDLRVADHTALYHALTRCRRVVCAFVFDTEILDPLPPNDRRVAFIHECVVALDRELRAAGGALRVRHGRAADCIAALVRSCGADVVLTNEDYEPSANARDDAVAQRLDAASVPLLRFKDQVIFAKSELLTGQGKPYSVFTPYKRAWLAAVTPAALAPCPVDAHLGALAPAPADETVPTLAELGFGAASPPDFGAGPAAAHDQFDAFLEKIDAYDHARDFPAQRGTSRLSIHLRHGTLSIRTAARAAHERMLQGSAGAQTWLSELIWRDFYFQILHHAPRVGQPGRHLAFKPDYDRIVWAEGDEAQAHFAAWCAGLTGYPLVDAAMRQLNGTGFMHNRLRMIVASFLSKDLGLDWRLGEAYFERQLNDFDLAANSGGWQWAASTGCDAQPYFRIFNPVTQSQRFDPQGEFIRRYVPEVAALDNRAIHAPWRAAPDPLDKAGVTLGQTYPWPLVDHDVARKRTLQRYDVVKQARLQQLEPLDEASDETEGR